VVTGDLLDDGQQRRRLDIPAELTGQENTVKQKHVTDPATTLPNPPVQLVRQNNAFSDMLECEDGYGNHPPPITNGKVSVSNYGGLFDLFDVFF